MGDCDCGWMTAAVGVGGIIVKRACVGVAVSELSELSELAFVRSFVRSFIRSLSHSLH